MSAAVFGSLRIWHTINFPREAFRFDVPDVATAIGALDALAKYDLFLGDGYDKPMTSVGARQKERDRLSGKDPVLSALLRAYHAYQLEQCPGGVPLVHTNAQGLETFEDGEWYEFYDEEGNDVEELRGMALSVSQ